MTDHADRLTHQSTGEKTGEQAEEQYSLGQWGVRGADMAYAEIVAWLDDWIDKHLTVTGHIKSVADMQDELSACRTAAAAAGIPNRLLNVAADGDLGRFLLHEQNAITRAELKRMAARDQGQS